MTDPAVEQLPPPPAGYTLDDDASTTTQQLPPPPAGYTLDKPLEPIRYENGMPVYSIDVYNPQQEPVLQGRDAEGKPIMAVPPPPPRPPIAHGLGSRLATMDPRTGEFIQPPKLGDVPLLDSPIAGYRQAAGGVERIKNAPTSQGFEPWLRAAAGGTSEILRGTLKAAEPLLPGAFAAAPLSTALTLAAGTGLSTGTEAGLNWAGMPKEYSALVSDLVGLYGAHRTLTWMGKIANLPYDREAGAIKQRLDAAMEQANDPNATPMDRAAAKARVGALMDGLKEAEAGSPGGYFFPQVSIKRGPGTPLVKNQLNPVEQSSQDYLTERGINTPLSMQTGDPRAAHLEGAVRQSLGGGYANEAREAIRGKIQELGPQEFAKIGPEVTPEEAGGAVKEKLAGDLEQQRKTLVDQVAPKATTPELAGAKVLEAGKRKIREFDQAADEAYKAAWQAERDPRNIEEIPSVNPDGSKTVEKMPLPIDMADLREALRPLADRYAYTLSETDARASLGLKTMRQIINGPRYKPASAAEMDLGMLKEAARTENLPELRDQSQGLASASVKQLQQAIDAKMATAAYPGWDGSGTSPALRHLQSGRASTAQKYDVANIFKPFGRNIQEVEPVSAFKRMTWAGDAGIEHLRNVATIAPEAMPEVGRAFIDSGGKWGMLGPETKKILFRDPELIKNLDDYFTKKEKFGGLTEMNPVDLFNKLTAPGGKPNELLADVKEHAPEQMPGLLRGFVGELWNRATREGDFKKVQSTLDKWLNMDPKSKNLMVDDPETVRNLDNLFFSLKRLNQEVNPSGSGYIIALNKLKSDLLRGTGLVAGGALGFGGHGAGGAAVGAGAGMMAGAGAEVLANKGMARLLFDPRFTKLLTQGIKFQLQGNNEGARLIGESLSRMASELPPETPPEGQPPTGGGPPSTPPTGPAPPDTPASNKNAFIDRLKEFLGSEEGASPSRRGRPMSMQELMGEPEKVLGGEQAPRELKLKPTGKGGELLTSDLGQALENSVAQRYRLGKEASPERRMARGLEAMTADLRYALAEDDGGRGWYTDDVAEMERLLTKARPEFKNPTTMSLFKYLLGITSNGVDPEVNFDAALRGWDLYKRDGKFSAYDADRPSEFGNPEGTGLTFRANSYASAMQRLSQLVADKGEAGAVDWLQSKHPVGELRARFPKPDGLKGANIDENGEAYGAYMLGPKVGAFGSNLNGIHTELTADKWWSRSWNRWMGTLMDTDKDGNVNFDKEGNPLLQDDPRNDGERRLMRQTAAQVAKDLGLQVSELQAILWYAEQRLYRFYGIDASSVSYADAARKQFGNVRPSENAVDSGPAKSGGTNAQPRKGGRSPAKIP